MRPARAALRYWHTVRHLRARQIAAQLRHRVRPFYARAPSTPCAGTLPALRWRPGLELPAPRGGAASDPGALLAGRFAFLRHAIDLGWPPRWAVPEAPKLWRYNLHYFEWLWALPVDAAREVAEDWIARNPPTPRGDAWEPFPVSLRLGNWLGVFFARDREATLADRDFAGRLWRSIALQAEWLSRRLETHLGGNHLLENGVALALAGSCFAGPAAERWLAAGRRVVAAELPEQILGDGAHYERSPMYHCRVVYLLLLLSRAGDADLRALVDDPLRRALAALEALCHPDGEIALLNDSAFGIYNAPRELLRLGGRPPEGARPGPWALADAGYYGFRGGDGDWIVCDAAPIGPDYVPGHAHGDLFSFELSLGGRRVLVDSGVHDYGNGEMRRYCRSTRAHNTVEVEEQDQCEFWDRFRVARRARPRDVRWEPRADGFLLAGWHDGYLRLPGAPRHHRELRFAHPTRLEILDRVEAGRRVRLASRLHVHPDCAVRIAGPRRAEIESPGTTLRIEFEGPGRLELEDAWYCPEFGLRIPNVALAVLAEGTAVESRMRLEVRA